MQSKILLKVKSGIGIFALAAGIFSGVLPATPVYASGGFSDTTGHWAQFDINRAVEEGIVSGYGTGKFSPNKKVSRVEFISMLNRALGNLGEASISFSDVNKTDWYYHDVAKAVNAAYASGFSNGTFRPNRTITRQEAAYMISMVVPVDGESGSLSSFSDSGSVSDWAYTAVSKIVSKGYMNGYSDNKLHAGDSLTRAQAVTLIIDLFDNENIVSDEPVLSVDGTKLTGKIYPNGVTISKDLDEGSVTISDCVILGALTIKGGGKDTITITDSRVANVNIAKAGSTVRVLAKGAASIAKTNGSKEFILQTSALDGGPFGDGFENVNLAASANATLRGVFGKVNINGSGVTVNEESGSIEKLTVTAAGKDAEITLGDKATVDNAYVNAAASFFGSGEIAKMYVNAKGVSYETKPKSIIVGTGGESPGSSTDTGDVSFSPEKGATGVYANVGIIITFDSKMTNAKGKALAASKIKSIVNITKDTAVGTAIKYSATMNTDATVFTIIPSTVFESDSKYYITIAAGTMMDSSGVLNKAMTSYFTTGNSSEKLAVQFSPTTGAIGIPLDRDTFTIKFSEKIIDAGGATLETGENSYLKNKAVTFLKAGTAVDASLYTVSLSDSRKIITIALDDDIALSTSYTLGITASTLRTESGTPIAAASSSWTSVGVPSVSGMTATATDSIITVAAKSSVDGKIYFEVLPNSATTAPLAAAVKSGTGSIRSGSLNVDANTSAKISFSGFDTDTAYKIYAVAYDQQGNASAVTNVSCATMPLLLQTLEIVPSGGGNLFSAFSSATLAYKDIIYVPYNTSSLTVAAVPDKVPFVGTLTINGVSQNTVTLPMTNNTLLPITVALKETASGKGKTTTYTVNVRTKSSDLGALVINGTSYDTSGTSFDCSLNSATAAAITFTITPKDPTSTVYLNNTKIDGTNGVFTPTLTIDTTTTASVPLRVYSVDGTQYTDYVVNFKH